MTCLLSLVHFSVDTSVAWRNTAVLWSESHRHSSCLFYNCLWFMFQSTLPLCGGLRRSSGLKAIALVYLTPVLGAFFSRHFHCGSLLVWKPLLLFILHLFFVHFSVDTSVAWKITAVLLSVSHSFCLSFNCLRSIFQSTLSLRRGLRRSSDLRAIALVYLTIVFDPCFSRHFRCVEDYGGPLVSLVDGIWRLVGIFDRSLQSCFDDAVFTK